MLSFTLTGVKFPGNQDAEHSNQTLQIVTFRKKKKKRLITQEHFYHKCGFIVKTWFLRNYTECINPQSIAVIIHQLCHPSWCCLHGSTMWWLTGGRSRSRRARLFNYRSMANFISAQMSPKRDSVSSWPRASCSALRNDSSGLCHDRMRYLQERTPCTAVCQSCCFHTVCLKLWSQRGSGNRWSRLRLHANSITVLMSLKMNSLIR